MCYVMLCYATLCYVMLRYVMLCYVMLFFLTLSYVILRYVTLCYVMLRYSRLILAVQQTPASIWYWCADQMMVQRVLAAKSLSHAQASTIFAGQNSYNSLFAFNNPRTQTGPWCWPSTGYLKMLPVFLMVIPGMVARVLYTDTVGCATPATCLAYCGSEVQLTDYNPSKVLF